MTSAPASLPTVTDTLRAGAALRVHCLGCNRWSEADLADLERRGLGGRALRDLPLRCRVCGGTRYEVVVSGHRMAGG